MCLGCEPGALLDAAGLKPTARRLRVLRELAGAREALSAPALLARLREDAPMDKVTLYRTLEALEAAGLAGRHEDGDGGARYCLAGPSHPDHHHFYCRSCKRLLCLEPDAVRVGAEVPGVEHVSVRLDGTCGQCRSASG